jgi:hypothetical protein
MIGDLFLFLALLLPCIALGIEADRLARNSARRAEGRDTIRQDYGTTALLLSAGFVCLMIARVAAAGAAQ